jgi:hypothetical protein
MCLWPYWYLRKATCSCRRKRRSPALTGSPPASTARVSKALDVPGQALEGNVVAAEAAHPLEQAAEDLNKLAEGSCGPKRAPWTCVSPYCRSSYTEAACASATDGLALPS